MNRTARVRAAGAGAKETMRHAAEVVGPHAVSARDSAARCAGAAGRRLRPHARQAADRVRETYGTHLAPRLEQGIEQARERLPEPVDDAAGRAYDRTRQAARKARETAGPRLTAARAAAGPAYEKLADRYVAAVAGLRGDVSPREIRRAVLRRERRVRMWRAARWAGVAGVAAGGAYALWKWWERQADPDWLMEPPAATEVGDPDVFAVEESPVRLQDPELDPEVAAKQADLDEDEEVGAAVTEEEQPPEQGGGRR